MTTLNLTPRETQLITIAFRSLKAKPDIDYDLFASLANLKGSKSARDTFHPLYKKLLAAADGGTPASPVGKKKATTPKKRKGECFVSFCFESWAGLC